MLTHQTGQTLPDHTMSTGLAALLGLQLRSLAQKADCLELIRAERLQICHQAAFCQVQ